MLNGNVNLADVIERVYPTHFESMIQKVSVTATIN